MDHPTDHRVPQPPAAAPPRTCTGSAAAPPVGPKYDAKPGTSLQSPQLLEPVSLVHQYDAESVAGTQRILRGKPAWTAMFRSVRDQALLFLAVLFSDGGLPGEDTRRKLPPHAAEPRGQVRDGRVLY